MKVLFRSLMVCCCILACGCVSNAQKKDSKAVEAIKTPGIEVVHDLSKKGDVLYQTRDYEEAKTAYLKVLDIDPKNLNALYKLGNIAFRSRDWQTAIQRYDQVIEIEPRHTRAQYNLAMTYLTMAERHLKFYAAHVDSNANIDSVSKLIAALEDISNPSSSGTTSSASSYTAPATAPTPSNSTSDESSLDKLLDVLSK